jgi:hypothetical protein
MPKPKPNPDTQFNFRDAALATYYNDNYGTSPTGISVRSLKAKRDLERYHLLLKEALPRFTEEDAIAIFSALNGCNTSHADMLATLQQGLDLEPSLKAKIVGLSLCQWLAIVDACDRVGMGGYQVENLQIELRRVRLA